MRIISAVLSGLIFLGAAVLPAASQNEKTSPAGETTIIITAEGRDCLKVFAAIANGGTRTVVKPNLANESCVIRISVGDPRPIFPKANFPPCSK